MIEQNQQKPENNQPTIKRVFQKKYKVLLTIFVCVVIIGLGYLAYTFILIKPVKELENPQVTQQPILQLDVLNGCGATGVGAKFTNYLRLHGFDVVETKNYKSSQIPQTLVVDRIGNLSAVRRVAEALGVKESNIVQQINPDYFVDVSVVIGKDYSQLNPYH